jgi:hypothetical protein
MTRAPQRAGINVVSRLALLDWSRLLVASADWRILRNAGIATLPSCSDIQTMIVGCALLEECRLSGG